MKNWLVYAGLGILASVGVAVADNNIGCGWGTLMWEGQSGVPPKVLGATTNGTFGNQTFGISSGTVGCKAEGAIKVDARTSMFASANIDRLTRDMAAGGGETLDALAQLMRIPAADRPAFFQLTKNNFATIVSSDHVTAGDMLTTINRLMATDQQLSKYATL